MRAKHLRPHREPRGPEPAAEPAPAENFFYCSHCGSPRVAGVYLNNLNCLPDRNGRVRALVSQAEIDAIWPQVADPERYFYYCFACCQFGNCIFDAELLVQKFPEMMA